MLPPSPPPVKVLTVSSGEDMPSKAREIAHHFDTQGEGRFVRHWQGRWWPVPAEVCACALCALGTGSLGFRVYGNPKPCSWLTPFRHSQHRVACCPVSCMESLESSAVCEPLQFSISSDTPGQWRLLASSHSSTQRIAAHLGGPPASRRASLVPWPFHICCLVVPSIQFLVQLYSLLAAAGRSILSFSCNPCYPLQALPS